MRLLISRREPIRKIEESIRRVADEQEHHHQEREPHDGSEEHRDHRVHREAVEESEATRRANQEPEWCERFERERRSLHRGPRPSRQCRRETKREPRLVIAMNLRATGNERIFEPVAAHLRDARRAVDDERERLGETNPPPGGHERASFSFFFFFEVRFRFRYASIEKRVPAVLAAMASMSVGESLLTEYAASRSDSATNASVAAQTSAAGRVLNPTTTHAPTPSSSSRRDMRPTSEAAGRRAADSNHRRDRGRENLRRRSNRRRARCART